MNTKTIISSKSVFNAKDAIIPLSLYVHIPWCVKKCPYCDFNSHAMQNELPENEYIESLMKDLEYDLNHYNVSNRKIESIFFGGGTPSLFSPSSIEKILNGVKKRINFQDNIEITMEANPGTLEHRCFKDYKNAGINRVSLGAQSFQNDKLKALGRIHEANETIKAIEQLQKADLDSFNIDIMYGLPNQTVEDALFDLKTALSLSPPHLSWYHLTLEPNTIFYKKPPTLPPEEIMMDMLEEGSALLRAANLMQYEVSAYSNPGKECIHNLNYWQFGDYIGIGAGAHGKITDTNYSIIRTRKTRYPKDYLDNNKKFLSDQKIINSDGIPFEFMLNALRLTNGFEIKLFEQCTGISINNIESKLLKAQEKHLINIDKTKIIPTELGKRFLNELLLLFLN